MNITTGKETIETIEGQQVITALQRNSETLETWYTAVLTWPDGSVSIESDKSHDALIEEITRLLRQYHERARRDDWRKLNNWNAKTG